MWYNKDIKEREVKKMKVNNLPEYASEYEFTVCRMVDDEFWFYGAYHDFERAGVVALEIGGVVFRTEQIGR